MAAFPQRKAQCLGRTDASRKGGLDERAAGVVQLLNGRPRFCTTSSCSGRLVLLQAPPPADINSGGIPKKNCTWLMVTHELCTKGDVMTALEKATGDVVLKFEPFVLHVLCQELQDAQLLHSVAMDSGFRNSGISVGRGGKIMMTRVNNLFPFEQSLGQQRSLALTGVSTGSVSTQRQSSYT